MPLFDDAQDPCRSAALDCRKMQWNLAMVARWACMSRMRVRLTDAPATYLSFARAIHLSIRGPILALSLTARERCRRAGDRVGHRRLWPKAADASHARGLEALAPCASNVFFEAVTANLSPARQLGNSRVSWRGSNRRLEWRRGPARWLDRCRHRVANCAVRIDATLGR